MPARVCVGYADGGAVRAVSCLTTTPARVVGRIDALVVNRDAQFPRLLDELLNVGRSVGGRRKITGSLRHRIAQGCKERCVDFSGHVEDKHASRNVADILQRMNGSVRDDYHVAGACETFLAVDHEGIDTLKNAEGLIVGRMTIGRHAGSGGGRHVNEAVAHLAAGMKTDEIAEKVIGVRLAHRRTLEEQFLL